MKRMRILLPLLALVALAGCASAPDDAIIPRPLSVKEYPGSFRIHSPLALAIDAPDDESASLAEYLRTTPIPVRDDDPKAAKNYLRLSIDDDSALPESEEVYLLSIRPAGIEIRSRGAVGLFYGVQTLVQLREQFGRRIPAQEITDAPRFAYRGLHLDVSRHFFDKEFVKKQLRMMASLKLNRLHWHLTDGAGWRIAIDRYPLLTDGTAWRPVASYMEWLAGERRYCRSDEPGAYGGFYTKADIREVVALADSLHITVIPEIEFPGHSDEVLAVYPELRCRGEAATGGELCLGNEATYAFIENVLLEVMELFPSAWIHIGGDEASAASWAGCERCRACMERTGLTTPSELQGYAVRRIGRFLRRHGRRIVGWDEILDEKLPADAVILSWRGREPGRRAAAAGHEVVMVPNAFCYLDSYQDDPTSEPQAMTGYLPLAKVYAYDPAPDGMPERERVAGVQANLWTEYIPSAEQAEYMLYPRAYALSEVAWSAPERKDSADFRRRALLRNSIARRQGYNAFDLADERGEREEATEPAEHLAVGCPVAYATPWADNYPAAGARTLTDGERGGWSYGTRWQGFLENDVDVTVDLGAVRSISEVRADFIQWYSAWVWLPARVEISISDDGETFRELATVRNYYPEDEHRPVYRAFGWRGADKARYVRYCARSNGRPGGWLFTDEIIIN